MGNPMKLGTKAFLAFSSLFLSSSLVASPMDGCVQNNGCIQNDCCFQNNCQQAPNCGLGYNPSAHLQCNNNPCCGVMDNISGRFDILYWRPCSDGLQLGTEEAFTNSAVGATGVTTNESHAVDPKFKYDTGFKLGIGYYSPCDCWDLALNWTNFHSTASAHGTAAPNLNTVFVSDWIRESGSTELVSDSRWSLDLDLLDLDFAQKYYVNHCFILRPFIGLRAARIDQNYHVKSAGLFPSSEEEEEGENFISKVKSSSDFRGIGPRAGMDAQINLGCGVSIFGGAAASLVFGTFDRHSNEVQTGTDFVDESVDTFNYVARGGGPNRCSVTMTDMAIGLRWEHCFPCGNTSHPFALSFAWEHHAFYDINHFNFVAQGLTDELAVNGSGHGKTGDLTTQGLTVSFVVGF